MSTSLIARPVPSGDSARRPTVLSGVTPSGSLTLGNYLGALKRFADGQEGESGDPRAFFFVADLHALTTAQPPEDLRRLSLETAALFIAAGIDPTRSTVFLQSHVRAHVECAYLLESTAYVGELSRMIQFKEKGGRPKTRASLFTYPCLMAADILLYDADRVPVGGDQDQHVELARELALRFNREYGETFVVPALAKAQDASRVRDLADPERKMSKSAPASAAGVIRMLDGPDAVRRKISRAVTDSETEVRYDPAGKPGVSNLLDIVATISGATPDEVASSITSYGGLKAACIEQVNEALSPIQRRHAELTADPAELTRVLAEGAQRAAAQAEPVLARAREAIGLVSAC
jgi:tryptophanyl-tRNA synthetase